VGLVGRKNTN